MTGAPSFLRDPIPARLGRYEVRAKIGDGGMATVYLGRSVDPSARPQRTVALKVIKAELSKHPDFVTMFIDEAKIVSRLSHPNLVQVIELGKEGDRLFLAMELLFGQSLWQVWDTCRDRGVRLRYDMAAWIGARVAEGLHHAHDLRDERGQPLMLVHRDVNASNIFLTYDGQVKVIDFGLAKAANREFKTAAGVVKGKLAYLSPEQIAGQGVDRRSDVFALGTTLWELTCDRRLFRVKSDAETIQRVHAADVPDPTTLVDGFPPMLWQVLRRALGRDPASRYATAADFARSLDAYAQNEGRVVNARALSEVMRELFAAERERDAAWIEEASASGPAPSSTMHPPPPQTFPPPADVTPPRIPAAGLSSSRVPADFVVPRDWSRGAPPDGMFSPAPSRPHDAIGAPAGGAAPPLVAQDANMAATVLAQPPPATPLPSVPPAPSASHAPAAPHAPPKSVPPPAMRAAPTSVRPQATSAQPSRAGSTTPATQRPEATGPAGKAVAIVLLLVSLLVFAGIVAFALLRRGR